MSLKPVYLDYMATTPVDARVREAMWPYLSDQWGNASAKTHVYGREAAFAVEQARQKVAAAVGAEPRDIVFTSGATEAINAVLWHMHTVAPERLLMISAVEHAAVSATAERLQARGATVHVLPVQNDGRIDVDALEKALTLCQGQAWVNVQWVNQETGVIQPIPQIASLCAEKGATLHVDAVQALGKIPVDVRTLPLDFASFSAHKTYGPQGVGALYIRHTHRAQWQSLLQGGGQEQGARSGTVATHQVVGMGEACAQVTEYLSAATGIGAQRDALFQSLSHAVPEVSINGSPEHRVPHALNLRIPGIDARQLISMTPAVACSLGSACGSGLFLPSKVLLALGLSAVDTQSSLRLSFGRGLSDADITRAAAALVDSIRQLRSTA